MAVFTTDFEEQLVARLLRDRKFFFTYQPIIKGDVHLDNQIHRDLLTVAVDYYAKYPDSLTDVIVKNEIKKMIEHTHSKDKEDIRTKKLDLYFETLDKFYSLDLSSGEQYTLDVLIDYTKRQELKDVLRKAAERILNGGNISGISSEVAKVEALGSTMGMGYDYFAELVTRSYTLYEKPEHVVSTGFKRLNRYMGGGLSGTELGLIVGPPNRGKTAALVNIAVGALLDRKNVIYIVLEGSKDDIALRFDMRLARISKDSLMSKSDEVYNFVTYFSKLTKSKLIIQMFPTETATVKDIDDFLTHKEMVDGFVPDVIIIDYLNLCKRTTKEDLWVGRAYREGKALAVKRNKPLWSAVQARMGSLKSDVVTPRDIAEATGRIWADSDILICLCQNDEEEKKMEMRFFLGKNRNRAGKKVIPVTFNPELMLVEEVKV